MSPLASCNSLALLFIISNSEKLEINNTSISNKWTEISDNTFLNTSSYFSTHVKDILFQTINGSSIDQVCIEFDYIFNEPINNKSDIGYLIFSYNIGGDNYNSNILYQQKFSTLPLLSESSHHQSSLRHCLKDYVNFKTKEYQLILHIESEYYKNILFRYNIVEFKQNQQPIDFLLPFGNIDPNSLFYLEQLNEETVDQLWQSQWNTDIYQFDDYFTLFDDSIGFNVAFSIREMLQQKLLSKSITLSTKWIRYSDGFNISKNDLKFRLMFNEAHSKLDKYFQIYPRICNQLGQCFDGSVEPLTMMIMKMKNSKTSCTLYRDYAFRLPIPKTNLFRLEFIFIITNWITKQNNIPYLASVDDEDDAKMIKFFLFDVAHPCLTVQKKNQDDGMIIINQVGRCENNGICEAINQLNGNHNAQLWTCQCPIGYSGPRCEVVDRCLIPEKNIPQLSGHEICGPLKCQPDLENDSYYCLCLKDDDKIVWNATERKCVEKKNIIESVYNDSVMILYSFNRQYDNLPNGYDVCFKVQFNISLNINNNKSETIIKKVMPILIVELSSIQLFRHLIDFNNNDESKSNELKFCLQEFVYESSIPEFDVKFNFTADLSSFQSETTFLELFKFNLKSVKISLQRMNPKLTKNLKPKNYNELIFNKTVNGIMTLDFERANLGFLGKNSGVVSVDYDRNLIFHSKFIFSLTFHMFLVFI